jgi:penicillin G amidase
LRWHRRGELGSNNWGVDGRHTATGAAIVANDMHLGLSVPNTWFRARLVYQDPELGRQDVTGVTLPGTPVVVSGSNGHIAWGNTASCLDITDLVILEFDPANARRYRTPSGWREIEDFRENIVVRGSTNVAVTVQETIWGPVVNRGGSRYALACTLHEPQAFNLGLIRLERARDVTTALQLANLAGTPVNNLVVGDKAGNIGYSLLGRLPNRVGFDGSVPCSWADGSKRWEGWLPPERYPRLINPDKGVLWSANNRTLGSAEYLGLHLSSPDNGARAGQIRDAVVGSDKTSEAALWAIYHDDRALFLERWQKLMLAVLEQGAPTNRGWREARRYVAAWGARAAVDSQGYRLVRGFRTYALHLLLEPVNQRLAKHDKAMRIYPEDAAWAMIEKRPTHLLDPKFKGYDELLGQAVELLLADFRGRGIPLAKATWGERNHLGIRHPLSRVAPGLGHWLDMPDVAVSGDQHMPKVHGPGVGVSERMIVSPGHEENGLFNMPCGQSGHFLSPFYQAEMGAWLKIQPQPFLPGPMKHQLELHPAGQS